MAKTEIPIGGTITVKGVDLVCVENPHNLCRSPEPGATRRNGKVCWLAVDAHTDLCLDMACVSILRTDKKNTMFIPKKAGGK